MQIRAPWTDEQVTKLNEYQIDGIFHPFTCTNASHTLTATNNGWVCEECEKLGKQYTQDWCHDYMFDPALLND